MSIETNLTYLQKVALKSEVAYTLITSAHDAEMKYRIYLVLREVESRFRPFIVECAKESVTFSEIEIDKIYLEVLNGTTPVWLWKEEIIADIKLSLSTAESGSTMHGARLSINKTQERKNLIESAFLAFAKDAIVLSPYASEELFNEILEDPDLDFLSSACFYLKSICEEAKILCRGLVIPKELMLCLFDMKRILNFSVETRGLELPSKTDFSEPQEQPEKPQELNGNFIIRGKFDIDNSITQQELSNYISEKIIELFEGKPSSNPVSTQPSDTVYVVKKVFTDSGLSTDIRICKTQKEALNFIERIEREYPDITRTCEFRVSKERVDEKQKKTRGSQQA